MKDVQEWKRKECGGQRASTKVKGGVVKRYTFRERKRKWGLSECAVHRSSWKKRGRLLNCIDGEGVGGGR